MSIAKTQLSRADLLRLLAKQEDEQQHDSLADLLGFYARQDSITAEKAQTNKKNKPRDVATVSDSASKINTVFDAKPYPPATFYYLAKRERYQSIENDKVSDYPEWFKQAKALDDDRVYDEFAKRLPMPDLSPWSRLWKYLKHDLSQQQSSQNIDIPKTIDYLLRGKALKHIPYQQCQRRAHKLHILVDYNERLYGFRKDFNALIARLQKQWGKHQLEIQVLKGTPGERVKVYAPYYQERLWSVPPSNTRLVILSDLGMLHKEDRLYLKWKALATRLQAASQSALVLMPLGLDIQDRLFPRSLLIYSWDQFFKRNNKTVPVDVIKPIADKIAHNAGTELLLSCLSVAFIIEPELIRAVRLVLPPKQVNVSSEALLRLHPAVIRDGENLIIKQAYLESYREAFSQLAHNLQKQIVTLIRQYHAHRACSILDQELVIIQALVDFPVVGFDKALERLQGIAKTLHQQKHANVIKGWASDAIAFQSNNAQVNDSPTTAYWAAIHFDALQANKPVDIPAGVRLNEISHFLQQEHSQVKDYQLFQQGQKLCLLADSQTPFFRGSDLATITVRNAWVKLKRGRFSHIINVQAGTEIDLTEHSIEIDTGLEILTIEPLQKPAWAERIGHEKDGIFVETQVGQNKNRRWYWHPMLINKVEAERALGTWFFEKRLSNSSPKKRSLIKMFLGLSYPKSYRQDKYGIYTDITIRTITQRFRFIPPGQFQMGSPASEDGRWNAEDLHLVTLTEGFWLAETTCTQALWQAVMGNNPSRFKGEQHPVEQVSWDEVQVFIDKLNQWQPDLNASLPTEAEWEYACRSGTQTPFHFVGELSINKVNFSGKWNESGYIDEAKRQTVAVKSMNWPNAWGLHEMHGNVWEWCQDTWQGNLGTRPVQNPKGVETGAHRVVRGGSGSGHGRSVRSAYRNSGSPDLRDADVGFRLRLGL